MPIIVRNKKVILYHFIMTLVITLIYFIISTPSIFFILSGLIVIPVYSYIIYNESKSYEFYITPITLLFLFPLLMLGFSAIYHGFYFINTNFVSLGPQRVYSDSIVAGYILYIIFLFFYHLGIALIPKKSKEKYSFRKKYKSFYNPFILFSVFIVTILVSRYEELFSNLGIIIKTIILIPIAILSFFALSKPARFKLTESSYKIIFFFALAVLVVSNAGSLAKSIVLYSFIPLFFYFIKRRKARSLIWFAVALVPFYLFIIQPLINNARYQFWINYKQKEVNFSDVLDFGLSGEFLSIQNSYQQPDNQAIIFMNRLFEVKAVGYLYDEVERSGFQFGKTLEPSLYGLIPRVFWPEKPIISRSGWFTNYLGYDSGATGMTAPGELYWNFGFYGIILGGFILGILIGYFWRMTQTFVTANLINMIFYISAILITTKGSEFGGGLLGVIQIIIFFIIINFSISLLWTKKTNS